MKSATKHIVISTIWCALTLVVFLAFYNRLPAAIPVHFYSAGVANSFWPRKDVYKRQISKKMSTPCACSLYAPKQRQQPTNSFTTATHAKNGISISAKQVWRAAQQ